MMKNMKMSRWVHMPLTSGEYLYYQLIRGIYEGRTVYYHRARIACFVGTEESCKTAIKYYMKARTIFNLVGLNLMAVDMERNISFVNSKLENGQGNTYGIIDIARKNYEESIDLYGLNSLEAIRIGIGYGHTLINESRVLEAERFVTKLVADIPRVHGPEHIVLKM
jgi:hypothetical protein